MEIRKSWDLCRVVAFGYIGLFCGYLLFGLTPVKATEYEAATNMEISSIGLMADVSLIGIDDGKLATPDSVVGSYSRARNKTFLVGHASGVFQDLSKIEIDDVITYDLVEYIVTKVEILEKSEINMDLLLLPEEKDTIVVMTCAGEMLGGGDATHRLIVTASVE